MINSGDTAFILAAAGLVLLMTPGLALFYGGMVRSKNVLGTIMQSLIMISLISSSGSTSATPCPLARTSAASSAICPGSA